MGSGGVYRVLRMLVPSVLLFVSCGIFGTDDKGWGSESELNGGWKGSCKGYNRVEVTLNDGRVTWGVMESNNSMVSLKISNLSGDYFYDGENVKIDFSNTSAIFIGTGTATELSGSYYSGEDNLVGQFYLAKK